MAEITCFQALAFDLVDGGLVGGELVDCASPALAIQTAQGQWKVFGHAGAVAFSRTSDFDRCDAISSSSRERTYHYCNRPDDSRGTGIRSGACEPSRGAWQQGGLRRGLKR